MEEVNKLLKYLNRGNKHFVTPKLEKTELHATAKVVIVGIIV